MTTFAPVAEATSAHRGHNKEATLNQPVVDVLVDRCAGCQDCIVRCPTGALSMDTRRWVAVADSELCVGCRQCVRTCAFSAITVDGPMIVGPRIETAVVHVEEPLGDNSEIRQGISDMKAAVTEANRCLVCPDPTCVRGCPAHNDIPGFISALREGNLDEAHRVLRRTTVLPDICSRVCDQALQCEGACSWSLAGGRPVAIGALERFIADTVPVPAMEPTSNDGEGMSVAVVGSGPAGIGAAYELAAAGANVTVMEKNDHPGGLLQWGIPDFTLPERVANRPWEDLVRSGVDLQLGVDVTPEDVDRLLGEFDAVIMAHGASQALRLPVAGADLDGVEDATSFLTRGREALANGLDPTTVIPRRTSGSNASGSDAPTVLVLGAGNTAMDVARTARRLGAGAICVDWMDRRFAPVRPDELEEAADEGVDVRFSTTLDHLEGADGKVHFAHLNHTRQDGLGETPQVIKGSTETVEVDLVVMAMGYRLDPRFSDKLGPGIPVRRQVIGVPDRTWQASGIMSVPAPPAARNRPVGQLSLGREEGLNESFLPARDRVWVAGDALIGPSTVVEAMVQGRRSGRAVLAARPRRESVTVPVDLPAKRVLVAYESRGGKTARIASEIAEEIERRANSVVTVRPLAQVRTADLAQSDLLVIGSWVEGFVVAGVGPAKPTLAWFKTIERIGSLPVATFCTYGVNPRKTLDVMKGEVISRGGNVVASAAFGRRSTSSDVFHFVRQIVDKARLQLAEPKPGSDAAANDQPVREVVR